MFTQALRTVRRLPRPGSTRPPPSARLRLYGLYKQSMEGDVEAILPRPILPSTHPSSNTNDSDHDEAAELMEREREARGEIEKWDAWYACAGLSKTEAKRRYIEVLIQTMKVYAAGTAEARELVEELEFVWNQIRSQSGSEESLRNTAHSGAEAGAAELATGGEGEGRLRVLSPAVSKGGSGEVIEGEDASIPELEAPDNNSADEEEIRDAASSSERNPQFPLDRRRQPSPSTRKWQRQIETVLTKINVEMAALREQIDELNSSSYLRSGYSIGRRKGVGRILSWMRWILWIAVRQMAFDGLVLGLLLLWGSWRGDDRFERWITRRWTQLRKAMERLKGRWHWDLAGLVASILPARFS